MGWFSSLFSPSSSSSSSSNSRRNLAMSTHDAFSLPTSSPLSSSHPDAFIRPRSTTPDVEVATPSYAYPPSTSSPTKYDYIPPLTGRSFAAKSRPASLLPLHSRESTHSSLPPYPPLDQTWARIRTWLSNEYPELGDTLNWGILPQDLNDIEVQLGFHLPSVVQESYLVVDGQEAESAAGCAEGLFFGLYFLPLEDVLEEWRFWREVDDDPSTGASARLRESMQSIPPGYVRRIYSQRGWIPLVTDRVGNYLGVDLNPDEQGSMGQVIIFGREFDAKVVLWKGDGPVGWARWLASFAEELENREGFEVGATSDGSEGSDDGVGYESYFDNGGTKADGGGESAGLRLTGEYRGWNVLEAWADRSMKRWHEAGALSKDSTKFGLGVSTEVPSQEIDITSSSLEPDSQPTPTTTTALSNVTNRPKPAHKVGTTSVSKAPAPRPIELPSANDFNVPSGSNFDTPQFEQDLERGRQRSLSMEDEVEIPLNAIHSPRREQSPSTPVPKRQKNRSEVSSLKVAELVPLPALDFSSSSQPPIPDLLETDAAADVTIPPLQPVTNNGDADPASFDTSDPSTPTAATVNGASFVQSDDASTIRLVGDGGSSGVVATAIDPEPVQEQQRSETPTNSSSTSLPPSSSAKPTAGKHEKRKSISAGLKKIGMLGGAKRRTDSKENVVVS